MIEVDHIRRNAKNILIYEMSAKSQTTQLFGETSNTFFLRRENSQIK